MRLQVTMENSGGVLDRRITATSADMEVEAAHLLMEMITDAGQVNAGDVFKVTEVED